MAAKTMFKQPLFIFFFDSDYKQFFMILLIHVFISFITKYILTLLKKSAK